MWYKGLGSKRSPLKILNTLIAPFVFRVINIFYLLAGICQYIHFRCGLTLSKRPFSSFTQRSWRIKNSARSQGFSLGKWEGPRGSSKLDYFPPGHKDFPRCQSAQVSLHLAFQPIASSRHPRPSSSALQGQAKNCSWKNWHLSTKSHSHHPEGTPMTILRQKHRVKVRPSQKIRWSICSLLIRLLCYMSPHIRESKILDSTPRIPESKYWIPVFVSGTWILDSNRWWDSGIFELYSGFQIPGFHNSDSLNYMGRYMFLLAF